MMALRLQGMSGLGSFPAIDMGCIPGAAAHTVVLSSKAGPMLI